MTQYDFNKQVQGIDGKDLDIHLGKELAITLYNSTGTQVLKFMDWARLLYKGEPIELDNADKQLLRQFITAHQSTAIIIKEQLLNILQ